MEMRAEEVTAAIARGGVAEREAAYVALELAVREAGHPACTPAARAQVVVLSVACVQPLIESVLCAPESKVAIAEWRRASLLLYEMCKLDPLAVSVAMWRKDENGVLLFMNVYNAPDTVLASVAAKASSGLNRDDAITVCAHNAHVCPMWIVGGAAVFEAAGVPEQDFMDGWFETNRFAPGKAPPDRYVPLALMCLDIVRSEADSQPEGVLAGAGQSMDWLAIGTPTVGQALWEAGFLDVFVGVVRQYNPMQRVGREHLVVSQMLIAAKDVTEGAQAMGIEIIQPLLHAGAVDTAISIVTAYQMLANPEAAHGGVVQWFALFVFDMLLHSPHAQPVVGKLRSAGLDSFRYLLDHPLSLWKSVGMETAVLATRIAALVWGRDDSGGLCFKQQDIDKVVQSAGHRGPAAGFLPMTAAHGQSILSLTVSDKNKELLLASEGFIPLLIDSLLLDPEHPRQKNEAIIGKTDWESVKGPVQRDFAEAIAQLSVYPRGCEALLQDPSVVDALRVVAEQGWEDEARAHAQNALIALGDCRPEATGVEKHVLDRKHVMLSYQWDSQETAKRIVSELQNRNYRTWFDLDNMKGSIVDSMSIAIDNAAVMLSAISLAYKESSNCRLEAQGLDLIPLMMEKAYRPTGWLGLLLGVKLYFSFHPEAIGTDAEFLKQVDLVERELGQRGKAPVDEGVPPAVQARSLAPAASPTLAPTTPRSQPTEPTGHEQSRYTPSMRVTANGFQETLAADETSLLHLLLEREQKLREESKAELCQQMDKLRVELTPVAAISTAQLRDLQNRLDAMHCAELLSDAELFGLENFVADYVALQSEMGAITLTDLPRHEDARALHAVVRLSEAIPNDARLARQLRRKYL